MSSMQGLPKFSVPEIVVFFHDQIGSIILHINELNMPAYIWHWVKQNVCYQHTMYGLEKQPVAGLLHMKTCYL